MFNCRMCQLPFKSYFGLDEDSTSKSTSEKEKTERNDVTSPNNAYNAFSQGKFEIRSPEEIAEICKTWEMYIHPRAKEFWTSPEKLQKILHHVASNIDRSSDPILGDDNACTIWRGDINEETGYPVMPFFRGSDDQVSISYVNRILALLYADEESFNELKKKPTTAFPTVCKNPLCISLTHVALDDPEEE